MRTLLAMEPRTMLSLVLLLAGLAIGVTGVGLAWGVEMAMVVGGGVLLLLGLLVGVSE